MNLPVTIHEEIFARCNSRIFIFAEARSGSNWLVETLNSHSDIFLLKEIMQPGQRNEFYSANRVAGKETDSDVIYIDKQLAAGTGRLKGCKILFPQAVRFMDLYEFVFNYKHAKIILLRRRNSIRAEVSGIVARAGDTWHTRSAMEKRMTKVDPQFLYQRILWRLQSANFCSDVLKALCPNIFEIHYEDIFFGQKNSLKAICTFLQLNESEITPSSEVKLNTGSLRDLIANYQEIKDFFKDKEPFYSMFD